MWTQQIRWKEMKNKNQIVCLSTEFNSSIKLLNHDSYTDHTFLRSLLNCWFGWNYAGAFMWNCLTFNVFSVERSVMYWFKMFAAIVQNITNSSEPPHDRRSPLFALCTRSQATQTQPRHSTQTHMNAYLICLIIFMLQVVRLEKLVVCRVENLPPNISFIIVKLILLTLNAPWKLSTIKWWADFES